MTAQDPNRVFKSGFVTIAGAPNAGKSTLLNRIVGQKVSIISSKPQTTRTRILGVCHRPGAQVVFYDTPGIFAAGDRFNAKIVGTALSAVAEADLLLAVVDAARPDPAAEELLAEKIAGRRLPVVIALNKVDLIAEKGALLAMIERWSDRRGCQAVVPVSALDGTQVEELVAALIAALPEGPPYFPEEALTDATERFIAAELIREKIFRLTGEEVPYASAVTVEAFKVSADGRKVSIAATIHLERDSQKGIVIGKGGAMLKRIGSEARREIEQMTGASVFLKLFVRVQKNWRKDAKAIERFGY
ncbi:MAG: GTPase Era [Desulfobacterales bacterium]|jgi:GTP-binding protein Era|nr:GTPase Era [Desulfobacterales bacterium]